jgi:hypothetical protein
MIDDLAPGVKGQGLPRLEGLHQPLVGGVAGHVKHAGDVNPVAGMQSGKHRIG